MFVLELVFIYKQKLFQVIVEAWFNILVRTFIEVKQRIQ